MKNNLKYVILAGLFLIPFIPFLVSSSFFFPFIVTKAFTFRIIVEVVLAAWVLLMLIEPDYRPKKSPMLYAVLGFLAIIGLANILGVNPARSFWSNFERMEGYITLLHLGALFLVMGSVFSAGSDGGEKLWKRWWHTSLVAAGIMAFYASFQAFGIVSPSQAGTRVDGTFGNTIYLAVYMLFHIFIATFYLMRARAGSGVRWVYGALILLQIFILYHTATRGAILGLIGGLLIVAVLNIRNPIRKQASNGASPEYEFIRKVSIGALVAVAVFVGSFAMFRNAEFVQNNPVLSRFASLTTEEIKTQGRYFVWPIAYEGFKERPILGWGQENFQYVFQAHYSPDMHHLEPWFDRAHNIFLDWMVAGGILGILSYLSLYGVLLFLIWKRDENFTHFEKSLLTGLVAAYFFHNFFVFDHLISYVLFFSLLAYVYSMSSGEVMFAKVFSRERINMLALPVTVLAFGFVLYTVNIEPIKTNTSLLGALASLRDNQQMRAAEDLGRAYNGSRLGREEVVSQIAQYGTAILTSNTSIEERNEFFSFARSAITETADKEEKDAKVQMAAGAFLTKTGQLEEGLVYLLRAQELIPGKQQVYFELGSAYIGNDEFEKALPFLKTAYEMAPEYREARIIYLVGAIYAGDRALERELIPTLNENEMVFDGRILSAYYNSSRFAEAIAILEERKRLDPQNSSQYEQTINQIRNQ